jgi:HK97 gp10 family phage protein
MIKASVDVKINDKAIKLLLDQVNEKIFDSGEDLANIMKKSITTGSKSGNQYYSNGRRHQASSPGQSPANNTGELVKSISYKKTKNGSETIIDAEYAGYLEYGTSKMRPRPFILPAIQKLKKDLLTLIKKAKIS